MEGTKDIKNFTKFPSLSDDDLLLGSKTSLGGTDASITVANFKKQVVQDVKPSIVNGYWWVDNINTGVLATGRTPKFRKTSAGLEMKYEDQDDTAYILLIPMSDLAFTFDDLSPEQVEELKLKFSDLTDADKEALRGKAFTYDMFTPEQLADLRLTWDKLTPEQKNSLKGDRGYSAFEVWTQQEGNAGKIVDDYLAWLRQPATDAAKRADEKMVQISESASIAIKAANDAATNANNAAENVQDGVDGKTPVLESVSAISGETPSGSFSQVGVDESGNPKYILNLTLPKGKNGQPAVFEAGTTTTLAPSAEASVEVVPNGETPNGNPKYILNFFIPRGETGLPGAGSGNVSAEGSGLVAGKKYFFVPDASDSTSGSFVEYVDGPGSGIDADLLDGKQGSKYLLATDADDKFLPLIGGTINGIVQINSAPAGGVNWVSSFRLGNTFADAATNKFDLLNYKNNFIFRFFNSDNKQKALAFKPDDSLEYSVGSNYYKVWHAGNQGVGSGLDADLLDGKQGSEYALKTEIPDTIPDAPADGKTYGRKNEAWAEVVSGTEFYKLDGAIFNLTENSSPEEVSSAIGGDDGFNAIMAAIDNNTPMIVDINESEYIPDIPGSGVAAIDKCFKINFSGISGFLIQSTSINKLIIVLKQDDSYGIMSIDDLYNKSKIYRTKSDLTGHSSIPLEEIAELKNKIEQDYYILNGYQGSQINIIEKQGADVYPLVIKSLDLELYDSFRTIDIQERIISEDGKVTHGHNLSLNFFGSNSFRFHADGKGNKALMDDENYKEVICPGNITSDTTLTNLSIDNYSIKVTLSAASALSFASTPAEGWECMINIKNSSSSSIAQPLPNASNWLCDDTSITIPANGYAEISVRYSHGLYWVITKVY